MKGSIVYLYYGLGDSCSLSRPCGSEEPTHKWGKLILFILLRFPLGVLAYIYLLSGELKAHEKASKVPGPQASLLWKNEPKENRNKKKVYTHIFINKGPTWVTCNWYTLVDKKDNVPLVKMALIYIKNILIFPVSSLPTLFLFSYANWIKSKEILSQRNREIKSTSSH